MSSLNFGYSNFVMDFCKSKFPFSNPTLKTYNTESSCASRKLPRCKNFKSFSKVMPYADNFTARRVGKTLRIQSYD